MIGSVLSWMLGCRHKRITWPIRDSRTGDTTVYCQTCEQKLLYSWSNMRVLSPVSELDDLQRKHEERMRFLLEAGCTERQAAAYIRQVPDGGDE